ncbi:MAG: hypothetical protein K2W96_09875 [Gemmataceae bacterium]|nr:hypothetical protein [Gemmataceae bacterium]
MTFVGKLFLMLNLVLSLALMAAGMGLYATRIDWTDAPAKGGAPPGMTARKKAALKEAMETIWPAENSFRLAGAELAKLEGRQHGDRGFYSGELEHVRTKATRADPAREAVMDGKSGLPVYDRATGRPTLRKAADRQGAALPSLLLYGREIAAKQKENAGLQADLKKKFEEDAKETEKLTGTAMERGLRQHILDEGAKQVGIQEVMDATRPLFINTRVEAAIVRERIAAVDRQIKALKETIDKLKRLDEGGKTP